MSCKRQRNSDCSRPIAVFILRAILIGAVALFPKASKSSSFQELSRDKYPSNKNLQHEVDEEGLVFKGDFQYESDILPLRKSILSPPASDLMSFFLEPKHRDLVIKGGGNRCEHVPSTPERLDSWKAQSKIVQSSPPEFDSNRIELQSNQEILAVYSEVPIVPGLSLRAVSYTGCKTMKDPKTLLPCYEFTLLEESYQPVGKRAMIWIFDKVTGNRNARCCDVEQTPCGTYDTQDQNPRRTNNDDHFVTESTGRETNRSTQALSRITLEVIPNDGGCKVCYYGRVKLTLSKRFLHMLPLPKSVVQAKVNKSIRKQLERECDRSMQKFTRALNDWNNQQ